MKFKLFLWQSCDILTILQLEKKRRSDIKCNCWKYTMVSYTKDPNPFLITANYVELINHYTPSTGHEGIQCYQYFGVIKVLLRTRISASTFSFGSFCRECVWLILRKYFCTCSVFHYQNYFGFLPELYNPNFCLSYTFAERQKKQH